MLKQCLGTIDVLLERARDYGMQVFLVKRNTFLSKGGLKSGYKANICISSLKRKNSWNCVNSISCYIYLEFGDN